MGTQGLWGPGGPPEVERASFRFAPPSIVKPRMGNHLSYRHMEALVRHQDSHQGMQDHHQDSHQEKQDHQALRQGEAELQYAKNV